MGSGVDRVRKRVGMGPGVDGAEKGWEHGPGVNRVKKRGGMGPGVDKAENERGHDSLSRSMRGGT